MFPTTLYILYVKGKYLITPLKTLIKSNSKSISDGLNLHNSFIYTSLIQIQRQQNHDFFLYINLRKKSIA